jgi:hypothetical protein
MDKTAIRRLQNTLNHFVDRYPNLGSSKLRVDGERGQLTRKRFEEVQYDLGYLHENILLTPNDDFYHRVGRPNHVEPRWGATKEAVKRGQKRRSQRRHAARLNKFQAYLKPGVGSFDGVSVARTAIPVLSWCRANGWHGRLVSGYRTPAYSESLCYHMCGRPSCPGRCAGRATNHAYATPDRFAMDVSDYINFGHVVARCPIRPHVHNSLPNDRVHFSPAGN